MANNNRSILLCLFLVACGSTGTNDDPTWRGGLIGVWEPVGEARGKIVLHQGHAAFSSPEYPPASLVPIAEQLAAAGYLVYGIEMPPMPHEGRPLSDFTNPVTNLLDAIGPAYMVGLSGGGFITTVVTATDTRIIRGFSVSGDAPLDVWTGQRDWEQTLVDYRALYASAGDRLMHLYYWVDGCCFGGISGDVGYAYVTFTDNDGEHMISGDALRFIVNSDQSHTN